jgi:hypothetical protein
MNHLATMHLMRGGIKAMTPVIARLAMHGQQVAALQQHLLS